MCDIKTRVLIFFNSFVLVHLNYVPSVVFFHFHDLFFVLPVLFLSPLFPVPVCAAVASGVFFLCVFSSVSTRGRSGAGTDAAVSIVHQMGHLGPRQLSHGL